MGINDCLHGPRAYELGLVMGQTSTLSQYIGDINIIARFRVQRLRVAVLVHASTERLRRALRSP